MKPIRLIAFAMLATLVLALSAQAADPLSSWNEGPAMQAIVEFVRAIKEEIGWIRVLFKVISIV